MKNNKLIWLDLEMTGLNPDQDLIIEIATIITDDNLNIIQEGPVCAIKQENAALDNMDAWNTQHHTDSGLVTRVKNSTINPLKAEQTTLDFVRQYVDAGHSPMCGSTIGHDRMFLRRYMPTLEKFFHYRNIDVSSIKELVRRWYPEVMPQVNKTSSHIALEDIKGSIVELRKYRHYIFK